MRYVRMGAFLAFVVLIPAFLISANVRWVINFSPLYSYGFDNYDIEASTGIPRAELISVGRQIRDYFNEGEEKLDVRVSVNGVRRSLYNEKEIQHMEDVRVLVRTIYRVSEYSALYLMAFTVFGFAFFGRLFIQQFVRGIWLGGITTLGLVVSIGLASLIGFDKLFLLFHMLSFSNDLWQLDPSKDYLIAMFPQVFFYDATILIATSIISEATIIVISLHLFRSWLHTNKLFPVDCQRNA